MITWLTGFDNDEIQEAITQELTFKLFDLAKLNPKADQISGSICGYKIQDITTPLTKQVRYLDKLVDEWPRQSPRKSASAIGEESQRMMRIQQTRSMSLALGIVLMTLATTSLGSIVDGDHLALAGSGVLMTAGQPIANHSQRDLQNR